MLDLNRGEFALRLLPELGGSVAHLRWRGEELLRAAAAGVAVPQDTAAFPMTPFAGRIAGGRFRSGRREVRLQQNFPPEPHAIHGHGWLAPWRVEAAAAESARLAWSNDGSDWPWRCRATQTFALEDDGLSLLLSLENRDREAMPAGFGWHPYFPAPGASLAVDLDTCWPSGDAMIPGAPEPLSEPFAAAAPRAVSALALDHVFDWPTRRLRLLWPERGIALRLEAGPVLDRLVLYTPAGASFFCAEPLSHVPDAVNSALPGSRTGLRLLEPGEMLSETIGLRLEPRP